MHHSKYAQTTNASTAVQAFIIAVFLFALFAPIVNAQSRDQASFNREYQAKAGSYPLTTRHLDQQQQPLFVNSLINQESLYLLQHANNPVQWWAWEADAFAKAKATNKPIFLSIGYSTCHWCHVMARESFEDIEVANFINENFIPIKVDREEHPAVDELYLTAVQILSGKAGWPLTAVLTPDGKAFFGGTYFQPTALLNVLNRIDQTWQQRQDAVLEQANRISTAIQKIGASSTDSKAINTDMIEQATVRIQQALTRSSARAKSEPGFPREPELLFLLNQAERSLSQDTIDAVSERLLMLAGSGLHDHVGGGFHRYTVDSTWVVPHFEKMLYNQAQMARTYFLAHRITGNPIFKRVGNSTLQFVLTNMQDPKGGFYSAMDAESKNAAGVKGEGEYYLWGQDELKTLLSAKEQKWAIAALGVTAQGNFNGRTVLQNMQLNEAAVQQVLEKLAAVRAQRTPPQVDTKIITAWNAMTISALTTGYQITAVEAYWQAAQRAANRLWEESYQAKQGLSRTVPIEQKRVPAALEDYAYFANAMLDLYDVDGRELWLGRAERLAVEMLANFHDKQTGAFQISRVQAASEQQGIPMQRLVSARDDATYSGNSMAAQLLTRLYQRTGKPDYKHKARQAIATFSKPLMANPEGLSGMLLAANMLNNRDIGMKQYAVKGKLMISTQTQEQRVNVQVSIAEGWHINAAKVLNDYLIPTQLRAVLPAASNACQALNNVSYPEGERVSLGFQEDELLVYEGVINMSLAWPESNGAASRCAVAAELSVQACNDEVCLPPERVQIRAF